VNETLLPYAPTVLAMGATAALLLLQLFVVDWTAIKSRHAPGTPVQADPARFLFRATRAHANTNESVAAFVLLSLFGIFSSASPTWLNALCWVYVVARVAHMTFYYAGLQLLRSASFGIGLVALVGMLAIGVVASMP
jgi:uncharacterized MAPEG superfamily protein